MTTSTPAALTAALYVAAARNAGRGGEVVDDDVPAGGCSELLTMAGRACVAQSNYR
ncbi:MAG TPA: hypothetical protein VF198_15720 [Vicinamibacterales bacterium]